MERRNRGIGRESLYMLKKSVKSVSEREKKENGCLGRPYF